MKTQLLTHRSAAIALFAAYVRVYAIADRLGKVGYVTEHKQKVWLEREEMVTRFAAHFAGRDSAESQCWLEERETVAAIWIDGTLYIVATS